MPRSCSVDLLTIAAEHGKPVQFHTGFGDASLPLASAQPLLLEPLLGSDVGREATIVLIHGAFPGTDELACLVAAHPNTYAELSLFTIFAPLSVERRLADLLDLLPVDRVCFGTDGHHDPETAWFGARMFLEGWDCWADGVAARGVGQTWLSEAFDRVTTLNSRRIYGL